MEQALEQDLLSRTPNHVEDPSIEQLADAVGHTDEQEVRRQLFGWREALSIAIPLVLLVVVARNVDWGTALATIRDSNPWMVFAALVVYYATFPVRARRWARLLREGGLMLRGRDLLEILEFAGPTDFIAALRTGNVTGRLAGHAIHFYTRYDKWRKWWSKRWNRTS